MNLYQKYQAAFDDLHHSMEVRSFLRRTKTSNSSCESYSAQTLTLHIRRTYISDGYECRKSLHKSSKIDSKESITMLTVNTSNAITKPGRQNNSNE